MSTLPSTLRKKTNNNKITKLSYGIIVRANGDKEFTTQRCLIMTSSETSFSQKQVLQWTGASTF